MWSTISLAQTAVTTSVPTRATTSRSTRWAPFNVLEAARQRRPQPVVLYTSTNKVYGGMDDVPTVEEADALRLCRPARTARASDQPLDFHSPYGCSKGAADQYVRDYARIYGLRTVVFRQSCIYGPRQLGIEDQGWVARFVIAARHRQGRSPSSATASRSRDLLYIDDLLDAYRAGHRRDRDDGAGRSTTSAAGRPTRSRSGGTSSRWSRTSSASPVPDPAFDTTRPGDQPIFVADVSKASRDFGWSPTSRPADGIRRLTEWVIANRDLFDASR